MSEEFDPPNSRFLWIAGYWGWATGGSGGRFAVAIGGPLLLILMAVAFILFGGGSVEGPGTGALATIPSGPTATQPPSAILPTATATPVPVPREYTVQPGDSLLAICIDMVPELPSDECVEKIVELNGLADAGQIGIDQVLMLPTNAAQEEPPANEPEEESPAATREILLSCDHREPGVESDVIVRGSGFTPDEVVAGQVTGSGLVGDGLFEVTAGADGTFEVRVPIETFGAYTVVTPGIAPQNIDVGAANCDG